MRLVLRAIAPQGIKAQLRKSSEMRSDLLINELQKSMAEKRNLVDDLHFSLEFS